MNAEEHKDRLAAALAELGVPKFEERATALYAHGVRVLQLDEVIMSRADARLLDLVRQAAERWEQTKQEAKEREQLEGHGLHKAQILAALIGAGKPLGRIPAIQAAAGWHRDYQPSPMEWEPWRAAWRSLLITKKIRRTNNPSLGEESLWEVNRGA